MLCLVLTNLSKDVFILFHSFSYDNNYKDRKQLKIELKKPIKTLGNILFIVALCRIYLQNESLEFVYMNNLCFTSIYKTLNRSSFYGYLILVTVILMYLL